MKNKKYIEVMEEWGKQSGRPYHSVFIYKNDKRYTLGKRKYYIKFEWLQEEPFVKINYSV